MRKIPFKNYIILAVICIITFLITLYLRNLYLDKKEYESINNSRMGFLQTIKIEEFNNFITENRDFILYVSNADSQNLSDYESKIKESIIAKDYSKNLIYMDANKNPIDILSKYSNLTISIGDMPYIMVVRDGRIINIYYPADSNYDIESTIKYIENYINGEE